jgi:hypothetical protein
MCSLSILITRKIAKDSKGGTSETRQIGKDTRNMTARTRQLKQDN